jgi:Aspartyl protease
MNRRFSVSGLGSLLAGIALLPVTVTAADSPPAASQATDVSIALIEGQPVQAAHPAPATPAAITPATTSAAGSAAPTPNPLDELSEVKIEAPEPLFVAPTLRDKIGRIWAPVFIDGKGPFRLVLDTGASRSALTSHVAQSLGGTGATPDSIMVHGVTGSAVVPAIRVSQMEVGELLINSTTLPIVADAFGGAEGVLGREGLQDKRIFADFTADRLVISRSHGQHAKAGFDVVPLKFSHGGLLVAEVYIGHVRTKAIIDTGGQQSVGNPALLQALMRRPPSDAYTEDIIGVTLDTQQGTSVRIPAINMGGGLLIRGARIAFGDMSLFEHWNLMDEPTVLIGMDVLGLFDTLVIDYKLRELQIRPRQNHEGIGVNIGNVGGGFMRHDSFYQ